jgi:hypothetical protein
VSDLVQERPRTRSRPARDARGHGDERARRAAVLRARRRRRRVVLSVFAALVTGAFCLTLLLILPGAWPELPFPQADGLAIVGITGLVFGLLIGRWLALLLTLAVLPVGAIVATGGMWSGVVALVVAGPYALAGLVVGVGCARGLRVLARRRRAATSRRRTPHADAPTPAH